MAYVLEKNVQKFACVFYVPEIRKNASKEKMQNFKQEEKYAR